MIENNNSIFFCKNCLNFSNRPRITFDNKGWCNACQWMIEKKKINWKKREKELKNLLKKIKSNHGFDCIVPVSGGKDGSYISYQLKNKYKINPLTVTVRPSLELELGQKNLINFTQSGFDHIHVTPNKEAMDKLNKLGFIYKGFPYYGWLIAIHTVILNIAANFGIELIFYGEDGEVEYGGSDLTKNKPLFDVMYEKKIYLEGGFEKILNKTKIEKKYLKLFTFPSDKKIKNIKITHWSYYEPWDSYRNYLVAKEFCGLQENDESNLGTFTNFAQNDQALYALHTYMMFLKFGFGRAVQDAGIEIRRGAMTRDQAVQLVKLYDGVFPKEYLDLYLYYYKMTQKKFFEVIDKWANKKLLKKEKNTWVRNFEIF